MTVAFKFNLPVQEVSLIIYGMDTRPTAVIIDIDGTLSNQAHRQPLIETHGWDAYYEKMVDDELNEWCASLMIQICGGEYIDKVILMTGRPERYRAMTEDWLMKHDIDWAYDLLFMRPTCTPDGKPDHRQDFIVKEEMYREHVEPFYKVLFCVDDRKQVVDMWRRIGLTCLQCAEGNF